MRGDIGVGCIIGGSSDSFGQIARRSVGTARTRNISDTDGLQINVSAPPASDPPEQTGAAEWRLSLAIATID